MTPQHQLNSRGGARFSTSPLRLVVAQLAAPDLGTTLTASTCRGTIHLGQRCKPLVGASRSARSFDLTTTCTVQLVFVSFLALLACTLVAPSLFGGCKCHHPQKGDSTRPGGNMFIVQDEEKPYRELKGMVELGSDRPLEDVLVEIFDHPDYLLKEWSSDVPKQKRLAACVTSEDGKFCFRHLPPGKYELRASSQAGVNVTHVYVVVDKKVGQTKGLIVGMSVGT